MTARGTSRANSHTSVPAARVCLRCDARLRSENKELVCTCHHRDYDPRCDATWPAKFAAYIAESVGRTAHPAARFGIVPEAQYVVWRRIVALRKDGWTIESVTSQDAYRILAQPPHDECGIVKVDKGETPTGETPR